MPKLQALITAANNSNNSNFMDVPMGVGMITDILFTSPILGNEDMPAAAGGDVPMSSGGAGPSAGQFAEYGGINPDLDPDLAMALKVSLEEERARQKPEDKPEEGKPAEPAPAQDAGEESEHDEQYYLDQAIKMSLQEDAAAAEA